MAATEAHTDQTLDKVAVSGPILARIMQEFGSSRGDCDGLLFGHIERTISTKLGDDEEQSFREELTAIITGFYCSGALFGFYDGAGCIDLAKLGKITGDRESRGVDTLIGWFVGRRNSPARPSLREVAITRHLSLGATRNKEGNGLLTRGDPSHSSPLHMASPSGGVASPIDVDTPISGSSGKSKQSLFQDGTTNTAISRSDDGPDQDMKPLELTSKPSPKSLHASSLKDIAPEAKLLGATLCSPCLFMLFTESGTQQAVHTHDYRAYQYHATLGIFEPKTVRIVNIGPAFRGDYDSFSPVVPFPLLSIAMEGEGESQSWSSSMGARSNQRESLGGTGRTHSPPCKEQALLDVYAEGYKVERLSNLVGPYGMRQVPELEELYAKMLLKLENLAKQVCESSSALIEQEKINARLKRSYRKPE